MRLAPTTPPPRPRPASKPHLQFFVAVAQQDELWIGPWKVFHYQVVTGVVKACSGGPRLVGSPTYEQQVNSTASFAQVGQGAPIYT